jgi:hypothetical protein
MYAGVGLPMLVHDPKGSEMTATTVPQHHRTALPLISLLVAGAAATISVVAITTDDVARPPAVVVAPQSVSQLPPPEVRAGAAGSCLTHALIVRC